METRIRITRSILMACFGLLIALFGCKGREHWSYDPTDPYNVVTGSGRVTEEVRPVFGITGVRLEGIGNVEIAMGGSEGLIIEADDNLLPYLRTEMMGGLLVISKDPSVSLRPSRPIVYHLAATLIDSVELAGAGKITCPELYADRLDLKTTGAGDIQLPDLHVGEIVASVTGVGDVYLSGTATRQDITLTGVADYAAGELQTVETDVTVLSNGSATVRVSEKLTVRLTGTGCVYYIGDPEIETHMTGSNCLQKIG